jgi:hypothetical protein
VTIERLKALARAARSWSRWQGEMHELLESAPTGDGDEDRL